MKFDYVYHDLLKRVGFEHNENEYILHLWKLSIKVTTNKEV